MEPRIPYNFRSNLVFLLDFKKPILNNDIRLDNLDSDATKNSSHLVLQKNNWYVFLQFRESVTHKNEYVWKTIFDK